MENFLLFLALVIVGGSIFAYFRKKIEQANQVKEMWRRFAQGKGLDEVKSEPHSIKDINIKTLSDAFHSDPAKSKPGPGDLMFKGTFQGFPCALETVTVKKGDSYQTYTRVSIVIPEFPKALEIRPETGAGKLGKLFGKQDIQFQDEAFDQAFLVRGESPEEIKRFLTSSRRRALIDFNNYQGGIYIRDGKLLIVRKGQVEKISELDQIYSRVGELGRILSNG